MSRLAKINYYIDPEKKLVVGKARRKNSYGVGAELYNRLPRSLVDQFCSVIWRIKDIYNFEDYFTAKAAARYTDEFDEKVGKSIVAKKLNYKYHRAMMKRYQAILKKIQDVVDVVANLEQEHHAEMIKCDEELKKYE